MLDDFVRLFWLLLQLAVCREGRGLDNPAWPKSKALPLRTDVTMIEDAMCWYANRGMVERYEVNGRRYFRLVNWFRYQGNTSKDAESQYAPPLVQVEAPGPRTSEATSDQLPTSYIPDADANATAKTNAAADATTDGSGCTDPSFGPSNAHSDLSADLMEEILDLWKKLFPEKSQPKHSAYQREIEARSKEHDFLESWREAMFEASQSPHLQQQSWFQFEFFVRNDQNWQKCLNRYYASFDDELKKKARAASEPAGFDAIRPKLEELNDGE